MSDFAGGMPVEQQVEVLGHVEAELENLALVLRVVEAEGEADRIEAVRLAVRVVRLERTKKIGHSPGGTK